MKKHMMHHFADALRNFRSKMYNQFILPNIGKPSKLKVKPNKYGFVDQSDWDKFVEHALSDQFKVIQCTISFMFIIIFYFNFYIAIIISFFSHLRVYLSQQKNHVQSTSTHIGWDDPDTWDSEKNW